MRRVVVTGMGMVTPLGRDLESTWSALCRGQERRRADLALRRQHLPDPDRRRGQGLLAGGLSTGRRRGGASTRGTPSSPWPPPRWPSMTRGSSRLQDRARPGAVRRLSRLRRRTAGFPPVRQAGLPDGPRRARSTRRNSRGWGCTSCTRSARPSKSRARPRATWPASSAPRGPTPTA